MTADLSPAITDEAHLRVVPDGTIISWLRIPGDRTSEAVAFVRREVEWDERPPSESERPQVTVWISPGGWDPKSIEEAGVRFPCQVVRWGDVSTELITPPEAPLLAEAMIHGGTWAREKALESAVMFLAGRDGCSDATVLGTAGVFEAWLDRDPDAEAEAMAALHSDAARNSRSPFDSGTEEKLSIRLHRAAEAIEEARDDMKRTVGVSFSLDGMRRYADHLASTGR
jgi:hypothetical protein